MLALQRYTYETLCEAQRQRCVQELQHWRHKRNPWIFGAGADYKDEFDRIVKNTPAHVAWDNIYNNRQAVAHGAGVQMSFADLRKNYQESLAVLDALAGVLGLRPRETHDLN